MHLLIVYVGWSSTYLAIRVAVRDEGGFPPFTLVGGRLLLAGIVLLGLALWRHDALRLDPPRWRSLVGTSLLLWLGGNGLVVWAEQHAASSFAALLVGSAPVWVALMEAAVDGRAPSTGLVGSIVIGFAGLAVISVPTLAQGVDADGISVLALLLATACWAAGSIWQSRHPVGLSPLASSGLQHLIGGLAVLVLIALLQEPTPRPAAEAWLAWGYLVVFGSIVTFTSFTQALRLLPTSVVFTYSYVNPVGALLLGSLLLGEQITPWTVAGAALVLIGVAGTFHDRRTQSLVAEAADRRG